VYHITKYYCSLKVEADIVVTFNSKSILDKIKSIIDPDSMCIGTVYTYTIHNKEWKLLSSYNITKYMLWRIAYEIDVEARLLKYTEIDDTLYDESSLNKIC
jgi:Cu/Ag efflux pump CusA